MKNSQIVVKKRNGGEELYNSQKLRRSMENVGTEEAIIDEVLEKVKSILYNGISTKELFRFIHKQLDKNERGISLRYNLKRAMMELKINGGFVFEKFIGRLLQEQGYSVKMNRVVQGENVTHEIDVSAKKGDEKLMVEVKHHDFWKTEESIQTPLYVYARFLEVKKQYTKPMLATNTRFSDQSIKYAKGMGMRLMGWKYPHGDSLEENIAKYQLYPITVLKLPKEKKIQLLEKNILTIRELLNEKDLPKSVRKKINAILENRE